MTDLVSANPASSDWLPFRFNERPGGQIVIILSAFALLIRLYLSLTNFCIAADGVTYLAMARDFAAGDPRAALNSIFSPLYPWLISIAHHAIPDWELAGNLVSTVLGTATVAAVYYLTIEVFARRDLAAGTAALVAIHPGLAAYSATVRTEAGYIFLITCTIWALVKGLHCRRLRWVALAGVMGGVAYLYRTEGIGLLVVGAAFIPAAVVWRRWNLRWALKALALFAVAFLLIASPYLVFLRLETGHWTPGREFTAAVLLGMSVYTRNPAVWQKLGFSAQASPLVPLMVAPRLYLQKAAVDFPTSLYNFAQALEPLPAALLLMGLWVRGRRVLSNLGETLLCAVVIFYFCGFALTYTGPRFMLHLIAFTFGWVMLGVEAASLLLRRLISPGRWMPQGAIAVAVALVLLPRTLWPLGYDLRGFRYAARDIARHGDGPRAIVARDNRVAYYAGASLIRLPEEPVGEFCQWLKVRPQADYLMLDGKDERRLGIEHGAWCLQFINRYSAYGSKYYDLFAIESSK